MSFWRTQSGTLCENPSFAQQKNTLRCSFGAEGGICSQLVDSADGHALTGASRAARVANAVCDAEHPNSSFANKKTPCGVPLAHSVGNAMRESLLCSTKKYLAVSFWRRRRDLNPRALLQAYSLSRGAPSTTWVLLHIKCFAILTHKRGGVNYFLSLKQKI